MRNCSRPSRLPKKLNGMKRGEVPLGANHLTMFIDVQAKLLFWLVAAWEDDFTGYVLDYGAYPLPIRPWLRGHAKGNLPGKCGISYVVCCDGVKAYVA